MRPLLSLFASILLPAMMCGQIQFVDIAPSAGVNDPGNSQGTASCDFDNDGLLDIYLVNNGQANRLYHNNGNLTFTDLATAYGVANTGAGRGCAVGDYNNDGRPDIIVGNFNQSIILYRNDSTLFTNVSSPAGVGAISWGGSINWLDYNRDGRLDCYVGNNGIPPHYNYLFRNDNLYSFTHVAQLMGLTDSSSTLCVATADYDNDGDIDLFAGNQTGSPTNYLYRNDGTTFTNVTTPSGLITLSYTWGADWGDFDNDGDLDLYIANSNAPNQLYRNNGDGTFTEVAALYGVNDPTASFSCGWADVDNDGDLDLYVANSTAGPDRMYRNDGTTFTDVAAAAGMVDNFQSNSTSWGDFNNDGRIDLYLSNNGAANRLWLNQSDSARRWLTLKLAGVTSNRSAVGARVRIKSGGLNQIREVQGGSGHNGQNSLPLEFGVGTATVVDSVLIRWPSGIVQTLTQVATNQTLSATEPPASSVSEGATQTIVRYELLQNYPNPFNPITTIKYSVPPMAGRDLVRGADGQIPGTNLGLGVWKLGFVSLKVYDVLGRDVATLVNEPLPAGQHTATWDAAGMPSGVYLCVMRAGSFSQSIKLVLLR